MYLPISIFQLYDYCEYQIYLKYVQGIKVGPSAAMMQGTAKHEELEKAFLEEAEELEESVEEHIRKLLEGKVPSFSMRELFVVSEKKLMRGYIDEIELHRNSALIIDDKPGLKVSEGSKNQVRAYCVAFQEQFGWQRDMSSAIRNRDSGNILWQEDFSDRTHQEVCELISDIHGKIERGEFSKCADKRKCHYCSYNRHCNKLGQTYLQFE